MSHEKSLEKFSDFAIGQYRTETKVWTYLFLVISVIFGVTNLFVGWEYEAQKDIFSYGWLLFELVKSVSLFLFLYLLRLVSLFIWYVIIFWLLRWSPEIRRERFSATRH